MERERERESHRRELILSRFPIQEKQKWEGEEKLASYHTPQGHRCTSIYWAIQKSFYSCCHWAQLISSPRIFLGRGVATKGRNILRNQGGPTKNTSGQLTRIYLHNKLKFTVGWPKDTQYCNLAKVQQIRFLFVPGWQTSWETCVCYLVIHGGRKVEYKCNKSINK